jgi:CubicO group peptidase (beta-lactamase class C family)
MLVAALVLIAVPQDAAAQRRPAAGPPSPPGWDAYVRSLDRYLAEDSVVGAGTVMVRDGKVIAHHEYGFGDRDAGQRADTATIWHWGSITKGLTAVAIMQLRDRGLLSLDDPVTKWVPELRQVHDPYGSMDAITIRMLLSHSAGFQGPTWPYRQGKPWEPFEPTRWEQLVAMMPYQEIHFAPGTQFGYSNPGFVYLARIIEAITGDPYGNYIQKNIWTPLGMTRSYFGATPYHLAADRSNNYYVHRDSAGHVRVTANGRDFDPGITIPNSGWNAPLGDLARWLGFLEGAGPGDTAAARRYDMILRRASLEEMWRPVVPASPDSTRWMAMSFFVHRDAAPALLYHFGDQAGFHANFTFNPVTRTAVIFSFNTIHIDDDYTWPKSYDATLDAMEQMLRRP